MFTVENLLSDPVAVLELSTIIFTLAYMLRLLFLVPSTPQAWQNYSIGHEPQKMPLTGVMNRLVYEVGGCIPTIKASLKHQKVLHSFSLRLI